MSEEGGELVRRRGRVEIERLVEQYRTSGMGRKEFCSSHGLGLSTLNRHLKQQQKKQNVAEDIKPHRLVAVEVATLSSMSEVEPASVLTVMLSNRRRVEIGRGFDEETLVQLLTVLERLKRCSGWVRRRASILRREPRTCARVCDMKLIQRLFNMNSS